MDKLSDSCARSSEYPKNLLIHSTYEHDLQAYFERLNEREKDLFWGDSGAFVDFWESSDEQNGQKGFHHTRIRSIDELTMHLHEGARNKGNGARCRFMFVTPPNSRDRLKISRRMFTTVLSFQQVFPEFLDFVFPFGKQQHRQDFLHSGFREECSLSGDYNALSIPELGRSGKEIQICYTLKSVEPLSARHEFPWSIRPMAVFHSFDAELGHGEWIILKGNQLIQDRIKSAECMLGLPDLENNNSVDDSYVSTIRVHLLLCHWSRENWRWYIKFLEEEFQRFTNHTFDTPVDDYPPESGRPSPESPYFAPLDTSAHPRRRGLRHLFHRFSPLSKTANCSTCASGEAAEPPQILCGPPGEDRERDCSFGDLQQVQYIGEKANEVSTILLANSAVLARLKAHYFSDNPLENLLQNRSCTSRLSKKMQILQNDFETLQSRTNALIKTITERKSLLSNILEYRSVEASRLIAKESQESTENMRDITRNMQSIAQKTKQETVSMRIITLVTLLYLPSTFISTMMSTDMIKFHSGNAGKSERIIQPGAIQFYIAVSFPLTVATFVAWYGVYWCVVCKEKENRHADSALVGRGGKPGWLRSPCPQDHLPAV